MRWCLGDPWGIANFFSSFSERMWLWKVILPTQVFWYKEMVRLRENLPIFLERIELCLHWGEWFKHVICLANKFVGSLAKQGVNRDSLFFIIIVLFVERAWVSGFCNFLFPAFFYNFCFPIPLIQALLAHQNDKYEKSNILWNKLGRSSGIKREGRFFYFFWARERGWKRCGRNMGH